MTSEVMLTRDAPLLVVLRLMLPLPLRSDRTVCVLLTDRTCCCPTRRRRGWLEAGKLASVTALLLLLAPSNKFEGYCIASQ